MNNVIIGFGSTARVGKDYAFGVIKSTIPNVKRIAFADALKLDLDELFNRNGLDLFKLLEKEEEKVKIRPLMVTYGQLMRSYNENVWVDRAIAQAEGPGLFVFTDVRFPNEVARLKEKGGVYVHVNANIPPANEVEASLVPEMSSLADYTISNDFTPTYDKDVLRLLEVVLNKKGLNTSDFI